MTSKKTYHKNLKHQGSSQDLFLKTYKVKTRITLEATTFVKVNIPLLKHVYIEI